MQLGFVGLGKMGLNMVTRLCRDGHAIVAFDRNAEATGRAAAAGAAPAASLEQLVSQLAAPRAVWLMVPAGTVTDSLVNELAALLAGGDIIIDGGNSHFVDDVHRAENLKRKNIRYVDAGTSGGVWGLEEGYCLMVGGDADTCRHLEPIFLTLAPPHGYLRVGDHGAGHYVKMIHNGIEYGLMQAYAEGFELMQAGAYPIDLAAVASLWLRGSVVRSWLLELTARALQEDKTLSGLQGYVEDSGEGRWTIQEAIARAVPLPVITASVFTRFRSRQNNPFGERLLAALRQQFGGHAVRKSTDA
ncbi:MAG TPA: decarboxylating 6-phosphogluconate dehydrogenase [Vicinamibacterales bacterium]|nr:decarboxylating 6-phosphogluconate dehydrogenase [Vicinamibacterales bacterium]